MRLSLGLVWKGRLSSGCKQLVIGIYVSVVYEVVEIWNHNEGVCQIVGRLFVWVRGCDIAWVVCALCEGVCGVTLVIVIDAVPPCHTTTQCSQPREMARIYHHTSALLHDSEDFVERLTSGKLSVRPLKNGNVNVLMILMMILAFCLHSEIGRLVKT